jgi:methylated-DNA-[protein]-cysteine S-methyltransferase
MNETPYAAVLSAPSFSIGIECNADEITGIDYLEPCAEIAPKTPLAKEAVRQLRAWLKDPRFDFGLPLAPAGTHFQRRVWAQIASIPSGPDPELRRSRHCDPQRPARGGQCLRRQSLSDRRALPSRGRRQTMAWAASRATRGGFLLDIKRWLLNHEHGSF